MRAASFPTRLRPCLRAIMSGESKAPSTWQTAVSLPSECKVPSTEYRVDRTPGRHSVLDTHVEMGLMRVGDANNDNVINAVDFTLLKSTFGKSMGDPGYDDRADFNGDQVVNTADFTPLRSNFASSGCL